MDSVGSRARRQRADEADLLISSLFSKALKKHPVVSANEVALAAVGGFGRGELSPGSDLDITIIHSGAITADLLAEFVNEILYPLWDSKLRESHPLKIDHSVRTRSEIRVAAASDLRVALGLLDIRLICGSADLVDAVQIDALESWQLSSQTQDLR